MKIKISYIRGQMLIESFVAISIAVVGLLGIMPLLSRSLSLNRVVANYYIANNLSAEGIEIVKNIIDRNIMEGVAFNTDPINNGSLGGAYKVAISSPDIRFKTMGSCDMTDPDFLLLFDNLTGLYGMDSGNPSAFKRCVEITPVTIDGSINELSVVSYIAWEDLGGARFNVTTEDHFFNWR